MDLAEGNAALRAAAGLGGRAGRIEPLGDLTEVARAGNIEGAKLLLAAGADVNATEQWGGQSPLMWAAAQSQPEMIKLLLANGANADARGAVRYWERKVIQEPRPKDMNQGGFTALLYAAREGGRGVLFAVSADGRVRQRLVLADGDVREPAWSPYRSAR